MVTCRCEVLNVMSGEVAHDYARRHLEETRTDGMARPVLRCPTTGLEWLQERTGSGHGAPVLVLRRLQR